MYGFKIKKKKSSFNPFLYFPLLCVSYKLSYIVLDKLSYIVLDNDKSFPVCGRFPYAPSQ